MNPSAIATGLGNVSDISKSSDTCADQFSWCLNNTLSMRSERLQTEMLQWTGECKVSACAHASRSWPLMPKTWTQKSGAHTGEHTTGGHVRDLKSNIMYQLASRRHCVTNTNDSNVDTLDPMSREDDEIQVVGHAELVPEVDNPFQVNRTSEDPGPVTNGDSSKRQSNLRQSLSDQSLELTASLDWSDPRCPCCATCQSTEMKERKRKCSYKIHSSQTNLRNGESSCLPQSSAILSIRDFITKGDTSHQLKFNANHASQTDRLNPAVAITHSSSCIDSHTARVNPAVASHSCSCIGSSNPTILQTFELETNDPDDSKLHQSSQSICDYDTKKHDKSDGHESNCHCCLSQGNTLITENSESSRGPKNGKYNFRSNRFRSNHRVSLPGNLPIKLMLGSDRLERSFLHSRGQLARISSCQSLPVLAFARQQTTQRPTSKVSEYLDVHLAKNVQKSGPGNTKITASCVHNKRMKQDEMSKPTPRASLSVASLDTKCRRLEASHVHQVYQMIAPQCDHVRHKAWPNVKQFLKGLQPGSLVADVGCGSGRYLSVNPQVLKFGSDICRPFLDQARCQGHEVLMADNMTLPYRDGVFDAVCSIGVIHHFASLDRRVNALRELSRVLAPGGKLMVYVWAFEQTNRKFNCQDVLIPWVRPNTKSNSRPDLCDPDRNTNTSCSADDSEFKKGTSPLPSHHRAHRKRVKSQGDWEVTRREQNNSDIDIPTCGQGDNMDGLGTYPRRRIFSDDGLYSTCDSRQFVTEDLLAGNDTEVGTVLSASQRKLTRRTAGSETRQLVSGDTVISSWGHTDSEVVGGKLAKLPSQLVSECRKLGKLLRSLSFKSDSSCGDDYVEFNFNEVLDHDDFNMIETMSSSSAYEQLAGARYSETGERHSKTGERHSKTGEHHSETGEHHSETGEHLLKTRGRLSDTAEPSENLSTQAFYSLSNDELILSVGQVWGQSACLQDTIHNNDVGPPASSSFCGSDTAASTDCPSWCSDTTVVSEDLDTRSTVTFTNSEVFSRPVNHMRSGNTRLDPFSKTPPEVSSNISVTDQSTEEPSNSGRQKSFSENTSQLSCDSVFLDRESSETEETSSFEEGESDQSASLEAAGGELSFIDDILGIPNTGQYPTGNRMGSGSPVRKTSTYYNTINKINARARCHEKSTLTPCQAENFSIGQSVRNVFSKITEAFHMKKKSTALKPVEKPLNAPTTTESRRREIARIRPIGNTHSKKSDEATLQYYREISFLSSQQAYRNLQTAPETGRHSSNVHNLIKGKRPTFLDFTKKRSKVSSPVVSSRSSVVPEERKLTLSDALTLLGEGVSEESLIDKLDSSARIVFREMKQVNFGIRQFPMSSVQPAAAKVNHTCDNTQPGQDTKVTHSPPMSGLLRDKLNENQQSNPGDVFSLNHCSRDYFSSTSCACGNSVTIAHERRMSIQLDRPNLDSFDLLEQPVCSLWSDAFQDRSNNASSIDAFQDRSNNASSIDINERQLAPGDARDLSHQLSGRPEQREIHCYNSCGNLASSDHCNGDLDQCDQQFKITGPVAFIGRARELLESSLPLNSGPKDSSSLLKDTAIFRQGTPQSTPILLTDRCRKCFQDTPRSQEYTYSSPRSTRCLEPNADPTPTVTPKPHGKPTIDVQPPIARGHQQINRNLSRYYHVFKQGELVRLITDHVPSLRVQETYYDHANWCIVAQKI